MKQLTLFLFLSFYITSCNSQTTKNEYENKIQEQGEKMAKSLIENDFNSFSNYTHPKIIEMIGGKEQLVKTLEKGMKEMRSEGIEFISITIGNPSQIYKIESELQCTVPQSIEMKVPDGRIVANSTLIAISNDNGKNWYFIDTEKKDIQTLKKIVPNLSEKLVIPPAKKPLFYNN